VRIEQKASIFSGYQVLSQKIQKSVVGFIPAIQGLLMEQIRENFCRLVMVRGPTQSQIEPLPSSLKR
jgi:hypothetical protein